MKDHPFTSDMPAIATPEHLSVPHVKPGGSHATDLHPGHQQPRHTSHGGADHSHPHMRFHAPSPKKTHAGHFQKDNLSAAHTKSAKHVVPVGHYGPADPNSTNIAGNYQSPDQTDPTAPSASLDDGSVDASSAGDGSGSYGGDDTSSTEPDAT